MAAGVGLLVICSVLFLSPSAYFKSFQTETLGDYKTGSAEFFECIFVHSKLVDQSVFVKFQLNLVNLVENHRYKTTICSLCKSIDPKQLIIKCIYCNFNTDTMEDISVIAALLLSVVLFLQYPITFVHLPSIPLLKQIIYQVNGKKLLLICICTFSYTMIRNFPRPRTALLILLLRCGVNIINPGPACALCPTGKIIRKNQLLTTCYKCKRCFHRICLNPNIEYKDFHSNYMTNNWECEDCKNNTINTICNICKLNRKSWILYKCSKCSQMYHRSCLKRASHSILFQNQTWTCHSCLTAAIPSTNSSIKTKFKPILPKGIKFGHCNVRDLNSLSKKDDIKTLLFQHKFDIFIVAESWLNDKHKTQEYEANGYQIIRKDRTNGKNTGGGLLVYVKDCWNIQSDISLICDPTDAIKLTIKKPHLKPITILALYRPSYTNNSFFTQLEEEIMLIGSEFFIIGDLNIDQLKKDNNFVTLNSIIVQNNLSQLIQKATRVTEKSSSLIDLIITNTPQNVACSGIIPSAIADHDIVYAVRKCTRINDTTKIIKIRQFSKVNKSELCERVKTAPWWILSYCTTVESAFATLNFVLTFILQTMIPEKSVRVKNTKPSWMTDDYINMCNLRDKYSKSFKSSKNPEKWKEYRHIRNKLNRQKDSLKADCIEKSVSESSNQSKVSWKNFNIECGRLKSKTFIKELHVNNTTVTNEHDIANVLCLSFLIPKYNQFANYTHNNTFMRTIVKQTTDIEITCEEVERAISESSSNKPPGIDGIPAQFLKIIYLEISPILTDLFNRSLREKEFPFLYKQAIVMPLYKNKGNKSDPKNYRPISILCSISKIFEKIVYKKLKQHFLMADTLSPHQHGFRSCFSTFSAIARLTHDIFEAGENRKITAAVFIDYKTAFDSVLHEKFEEKLESVGVSGDLSKWIMSYLQGRTITVKVNDSFSTPGLIVRGTPQGSTLSALLFSIYINELPEIPIFSKVVMYADDICLYISSKAKDEAESFLQLDLNAIIEWGKINGLEINCEKTKVMMFLPTNMKKPSDLVIKIGNNKLEWVQNFLYLGVWLDERLNWTNQVDTVIKKMNHRISLICKHKRFFSEKRIKVFCESLVISTLDYCLPIWGEISQGKIDRIDGVILRMCNKLFSKRVTVCKPQVKWNALEVAGMLTFKERKELYSLHFVYKHIIIGGSQLSESLKSIIKQIEPVRELRNNRSLETATNFMTSFGRKSFFYNCVSFWNNLSSSVQSADCFTSFDKELRPIIILKYRKK